MGRETLDPCGYRAFPDCFSAGEIISLASATQVSCKFEFISAGCCEDAAMELANKPSACPRC